MAPLKNARHERFVQFLLQGENATDAYELAGFRRDDGNACHLAKRPAVAARLAELQAEIAGENKITVASLLDELEEARKRADSLDQLATVVQAVTAKAKISGLMAPQKLEVGGPGDFDGLTTIAQVAQAMAEEMISGIGNAEFLPIEDADYAAIAGIMERAFAEIDEHLDAIKARPLLKTIIQPQPVQSTSQTNRMRQ